MIWRRLWGIVLLLVGVFTVVIVVAVLIMGRRAIDNTAAQLEAGLATTDESLDTVVDTLQTLKLTLRRVNESLDTVEISARNVATTISDTQPLLENVETIAGEDIAGSLETIEGTLPSLVEVAGAIDDTLTTLDAFQFATEIPLGTLDFGPLGEVELPTINFGFDLGIDYQPVQPFDQSVQAIGDSLDGIPEQLRDTATQIGVANDNLGGLSSNLEEVASDIAAISRTVDEIPAQLDAYVVLVGDVQTSLRRSQERIPAQAARLKSIYTLVIFWLGLTQLAPLYLGSELLTGRRDGPPANEETTAADDDLDEPAAEESAPPPAEGDDDGSPSSTEEVEDTDATA